MMLPCAKSISFLCTIQIGSIDIAFHLAGISMLTLTPGIAQELRQRSSRYSNVESGVFVANVTRGYPADRSGSFHVLHAHEKLTIFG